MLKINFSDMHRGFDPQNNFIVDILSRRCGAWEISENPDILFFSCSGTSHYRYDNCVKVFITGEPVVADFNICDYAIAFPYMSYADRYLKRPAWFTHTPPISVADLGLEDEYLLNRKFCNFVYSNDSRGSAVDFRKQFAKRLMEYKQVDCPGRVLNNMPSDSIAPRRGDWRDGKIEFIKDYKFTIAFENCKMPGYSTEKIEDPLLAHSVPIYWGDPEVYRLYNVDSFVYVNGYEDNLEAIIDRIIYLDTHNEEYLNMVKANPVIGDYQEDIAKVEDFIVSIVNNGKHVETRDPLGFGKVMTVPDYKTKELLNLLCKKVTGKIKNG